MKPNNKTKMSKSKPKTIFQLLGLHDYFNDKKQEEKNHEI